MTSTSIIGFDSAWTDQVTLRERQEFAVMSILENAVKGDDSIETCILAGCIMEAIDDIAFDDEVNEADEAAKAMAKPRIRVPAVSRPDLRVSHSSDLRFSNALAAFGVKPDA